MAAIDQLLDIIQKRAYYEAGGGRSSNAEAIGQILGNVGTGLTSFADQRRQKIAEAIGLQDASIKKAEDLRKKQKISEVFGTPIVKSQIEEAEQAPIPLEDLISGKLNTLSQAGIDTAAQTARGVQDQYGNATLGDLPEMEIISKIKERMRPEGKYQAEDRIVQITAPEAAISNGRLKEGQKVPASTRDSVLSLGRAEAQAETTEARQRRLAEEAETRRIEAEKRAEERKPPTESQASSALYAKRMEQSAKTLDTLSAYAQTANPITFDLLSKAPNIANKLKDKDFQLYEQAKRNFLNAVLRRESGAVISPTEFAEGNKQYFTLPGDSDEVIAQKKQNREIAIDGLKVGAGKAYTPSNELFAINPETGARIKSTDGGKTWQLAPPK